MNRILLAVHAGLDVVQAQCLLPRLQPGRDWVLFKNMGAYTSAGACDFNGFNVSTNVSTFFVTSLHDGL